MCLGRRRRGGASLLDSEHIARGKSRNGTPLLFFFFHNTIQKKLHSFFDHMTKITTGWKLPSAVVWVFCAAAAARGLRAATRARHSPQS